MNEVKRPKKPLIYYYMIVLVVMMLINLIAVPWFAEKQIREVDYGTFLTMIDEGDIGRVDVQSNQILFTDKEETKIYKTGLMYDPNLTQRLYDAGITSFGSEIVEETSPFLSILLSWILPIVIFVGLGQFLSKKMMDKAGGGAGAMSFNTGRSSAKVYVKSSDGISFADVEGVDEAEESLAARSSPPRHPSTARSTSPR